MTVKFNRNYIYFVSIVCAINKLNSSKWSQTPIKKTITPIIERHLFGYHKEKLLIHECISVIAFLPLLFYLSYFAQLAQYCGPVNGIVLYDRIIITESLR